MRPPLPVDHHDCIRTPWAGMAALSVGRKIAYEPFLIQARAGERRPGGAHHGGFADGPAQIGIADFGPAQALILPALPRMPGTKRQ